MFMYTKFQMPRPPDPNRRRPKVKRTRRPSTERTAPRYPYTDPDGPAAA